MVTPANSNEHLQINAVELVGTLIVASMSLFAIRVIGVRAMDVIRPKTETMSNAADKALEITKNALDKKTN